MNSTSVKVRIQPGDTIETLKIKAKNIAKIYIKETFTGISLVEIVEPDYVVFKIFFLSGFS